MTTSNNTIEDSAITLDQEWDAFMEILDSLANLSDTLYNDKNYPCSDEAERIEALVLKLRDSPRAIARYKKELAKQIEELPEYNLKYGVGKFGDKWAPFLMRDEVLALLAVTGEAEEK